VNYRHAFHAGNFADCMKHALLQAALAALQRKAKPIFVLDSHAGAGSYDLGGAAARRSGEWQHGIALLQAGAAPPALAPYLDLVARLGLYPGSPRLIEAMLRPGDRLACCELHPEEAAALRRLFAGASGVSVHHRCGWEALGALLPPPERRGLVLIDPPFEARDEFARLLAGIETAYRRFANGVLLGWYPIKHGAPIRAFHAGVRASRGLRDVIACELHLRAPLDPARLNGSGMIVVNPPFGFKAAARAILAALAERLAPGAPEAGCAVIELVDE